MTTKLAMIQQRVSEHFAAKEARSKAYINDPDSLETYQANYDYNPSQDAAMSLLRELLPLLTAVGEVYQHRMGSADYWDSVASMDLEVAKLIKEVE